MTNKQDANSEAESLENGAQNNATQISPTTEKDALSEKSLDEVILSYLSQEADR